MSQVIDEDETYRYEVLRHADCAECASLLAATFTGHNPYEVYIQTPFAQFHSDALSLCTSIVDSNLSVIARHKQSNEIHGIVQGIDVKTFDLEQFLEVSPDDSERTPDPIVPLMMQCGEEYMKEYKQKYGELTEKTVAHILMAGVRSDCHGQGVATRLHRVFFDNLRRQGFRQVIVDATAPAIHHIYTKKFNGHVFKSINFSSYITKNDKGEDYRPLEFLNVEYTFIVIDL